MLYELAEKVQSPLEKRFLEDCVTVGLRVEPQYKIGPLHADFAIPEKKIAIEIDSDQYHSTEEQFNNDYRRNEIYESYGWRVFRLRNKFIYLNGETLASEIKCGKLDDTGSGWFFG